MTILKIQTTALTAAIAIAITNTALSAGSQGGSLRDTSPVLRLLPSANGSPAPATIRPGTRLIYRWAGAKLPGKGYDWKEDANGEFIDNATGRRYSPFERNNKPNGGAGFTEVTVAGMGGGEVGLETVNYGFLTGDAPTLQSESGADGQAGFGQGYWAAPGVLGRLRTSGRRPNEIMRMPYKLPSGDVNALWIKVTRAAGTETHVYDPSSGILIHTSSTTRGMAAQVHAEGEENTGSELLTGTVLMKVEQLNIPWANAPEPAWTRTAHRLVFEGSTYNSTFKTTTAVRATYEISGHHNGWTDLRASMEQQLPGTPAQRSETNLVTSSNELGPMWIAPQALEKLEPGQVIDRDPFSEVVTKVSGRTRGRNAGVVISQANADGEIDRTYDLKTGCVIAVRLTAVRMHSEMRLRLTSSI